MRPKPKMKQKTNLKTKKKPNPRKMKLNHLRTKQTIDWAEMPDLFFFR
jgi:hypothetical protein